MTRDPRSASTSAAWIARQAVGGAQRGDEVVFAVAGQVSIEQGARETLTLEAEPAVLRKITTGIHGRRLLIGLAPGRIETQQPIRMKLGVWTLRALESRTAGAISIGPLRSDALALAMAGASTIRLNRLDNALSLEVRITGAGDIAVGGGTVRAQKVAISGTGSYSAPQLVSERAEVGIDRERLNRPRAARNPWASKNPTPKEPP